MEPSGEVMKPERLGDVVLDLSGVSYLDRQAATILPWLHTKLRDTQCNFKPTDTGTYIFDKAIFRSPRIFIPPPPQKKLWGI